MPCDAMPYNSSDMTGTATASKIRPTTQCARSPRHRPSRALRNPPRPVPPVQDPKAAWSKLQMAARPTAVLQAVAAAATAAAAAAAAAVEGDAVGEGVVAGASRAPAVRGSKSRRHPKSRGARLRDKQELSRQAKKQRGAGGGRGTGKQSEHRREAHGSQRRRACRRLARWPCTVTEVVTAICSTGINGS